jgi:hypothetical protein
MKTGFFVSYEPRIEVKKGALTLVVADRFQNVFCGCADCFQLVC